MWRGHNREFVLENHTDKIAYLDVLIRTLDKKIIPYVDWHSFCLMGNHPHETGRLNFKHERKDCFDALGNWMRNAHSIFGAGYNRRYNRQGKVAYDRPKTKEVDAKGGILEVMFYYDANPVRAGMMSHPSRYRYSSHNYYAYGKKNRFTEKLVQPPEYLALGKTPEARQRKFRSLCDEYLRKKGLIEDQPEDLTEKKPAVATPSVTDIAESAWGDPADQSRVVK